jgi:16S rRNA (adenine1518-N6/adenine1519-N6)-dimethyltransferase
VVPALLDTVGAGAITLVTGDAMTMDLDDVLGGTDEAWHVVSNLPYNLATPLVVRILEAAGAVCSLLVMVQREVGERLAAGPGTKAYGAVSVKVAYYATARVVGVVPPTVFVPAPRVE